MRGEVLRFEATPRPARAEFRGSADVLAPQAFARHQPQPATRDRIRAELGASLAALLGHDILAVDLVESAAEAGMQAGAFDLQHLATHAKRLGADVEYITAPVARALWPAIVALETGEWLLVLDQSDTQLSVIDMQTPGLRREIPVMGGMVQVVTTEHKTLSAGLKRQASAMSARWAMQPLLSARGLVAKHALGALIHNALLLAAALIALVQFDHGMARITPSIMAALLVGGALCVGLLLALEMLRFALMRRVEARLEALTPAGQDPHRRDLRGIADALFIVPLGAVLVTLMGVFSWIVVVGAMACVAVAVYAPQRSDRLTESLRNLAFMAGLTTGLFYVFAGQQGVGWLMATGLLGWQVLSIASRIGGGVADWAASERQTPTAKMGHRRERLDGRYLLRDVVQSADERATPALKIEALGLRDGEVTALLGPNGAGKSALLAVLSGSVLPTQGHVLLDGLQIGDIDPRDLRRGVGSLETARLCAGTTLRAALTLPHIPADAQRQVAALEFAGLSHLLEDPRGLERPIADLLSRGERHALAFARLWLADPRVVLLDEPLQGVDQQRGDAMLLKLGHWLRGRTAVIATHDPALVGLCTQVIVMQRGQVAMAGPRDAVLAQMRRAARG